MNYVKTDRFGNAYQVVGIKDKKENGFPYGYVELKGQLYKIDVNPATKEGVEYWCKLTAVKKQKNSTM